MSRDLHREAHELLVAVKRGGADLLEMRLRHIKKAIQGSRARVEYYEIYRTPYGQDAHGRARSRQRPPEAKVPSDKDFVLAWIQSSTAADASWILDIPEHVGWVSQKAGQLRKAGVRLPKRPLYVGRPKERGVDVDGLNALIGEST